MGLLCTKKSAIVQNMDLNHMNKSILPSTMTGLSSTRSIKRTFFKDTSMNYPNHLTLDKTNSKITENKKKLKTIHSFLSLTHNGKNELLFSILITPSLCTYFSNFLQTIPSLHIASNALKFWLQVQDFMSYPEGKYRNKKAKSIYHTFIRWGAKDPIPIFSSSIQNICIDLHFYELYISNDIFLSLQNEIFLYLVMMGLDKFIDPMNSSTYNYNSLLQNLKPEDTDTKNTPFPNPINVRPFNLMSSSRISTEKVLVEKESHVVIPYGKINNNDSDKKIKYFPDMIKVEKTKNLFIVYLKEKNRIQLLQCYYEILEYQMFHEMVRQNNLDKENELLILLERIFETYLKSTSSYQIYPTVDYINDFLFEINEETLGKNVMDNILNDIIIQLEILTCLFMNENHLSHQPDDKNNFFTTLPSYPLASFKDRGSSIISSSKLGKIEFSDAYNINNKCVSNVSNVFDNINSFSLLEKPNTSSPQNTENNAIDSLYYLLETKNSVLAGFLPDKNLNGLLDFIDHLKNLKDTMLLHLDTDPLHFHELLAYSNILSCDLGFFIVTPNFLFPIKENLFSPCLTKLVPNLEASLKDYLRYFYFEYQSSKTIQDLILHNVNLTKKSKNNLIAEEEKGEKLGSNPKEIARISSLNKGTPKLNTDEKIRIEKIWKKNQRNFSSSQLQIVKDKENPLNEIYQHENTFPYFENYIINKLYLRLWWELFIDLHEIDWFLFIYDVSIKRNILNDFLDRYIILIRSKRNLANNANDPSLINNKSKNFENYKYYYTVDDKYLPELKLISEQIDKYVFHKQIWINLMDGTDEKKYILNVLNSFKAPPPVRTLTASSLYAINTKKDTTDSKLQKNNMSNISQNQTGRWPSILKNLYCYGPQSNIDYWDIVKSCTLQDILKNPKVLMNFILFLRKHSKEELIYFFIDVEEYHQFGKSSQLNDLTLYAYETIKKKYFQQRNNFFSSNYDISSYLGINENIFNNSNIITDIAFDVAFNKIKTILTQQIIPLFRENVKKSNVFGQEICKKMDNLQMDELDSKQLKPSFDTKYDSFLEENEGID